MSGPVPTRADDEALLAILALFAEGYSAQQIGRHLGIGRNSVRGLVHRVRTADVKESGEPEADVRAGYRQ